MSYNTIRDWTGRGTYGILIAAGSNDNRLLYNSFRNVSYPIRDMGSGNTRVGANHHNRNPMHALVFAMRHDGLGAMAPGLIAPP